MFRKFVLLLLISSCLAAAQVASPSAAAATESFHVTVAPIAAPERSPFKNLLILDTAAWAADTATTQAGILKGATEINPIFGPHPSPARLWGTSAALQGIFLYSCYLDRRAHPQGRFWKTMMKISSAAHAGAAVNNAVVLGMRSH